MKKMILAAVPLILLLVLSTISFVSATSKVVFEMGDPVGDDNGPGTYVYPTGDDFASPGAFDFTHFKVSTDENYVVFEFTYVTLGDNPWGAGYGFSLQYQHVYIDKDRKSGSGSENTYGANLRVDPADAWEVALVIGPDPTWNPPGPNGVYVYDFARDNMTTYHGSIMIENKDNSVIAKVPITEIGEPTDEWAYTVITGPWDTGHFRAVGIEPDTWTCGGANTDALASGVAPLAFDILVPKGMDQATVLKSYDVDATPPTFATVHAVSLATEAPASQLPLSTLAIIGGVIVAIIVVATVIVKRR